MELDRLGTRLPAVAVHLAGWTIVITLSWYFTLLLSPIPERITVLAYSTVLLIGLFYANYGMFIPRIGNKWHLLLYSLSVVAVLILYFRIPSMVMGVPVPGIGSGPGHPPIPELTPRPMFPHGGGRHQMSEYSRVRLLLFALIYIFSTSIGILNMMNRYRRKQQEAEHEKSKAQLQLLTSQVNPHFLFNTLNAIYYLTAGKSDKAPDAVLQLADIMRYTLTESQSEHVPLQSEMDFLRKYIDLQSLRLTDKTTVDAALPQHTEGLMIAPLLLIPYIENCFKYGVSAHHASSISIKISVSGQRELRAVLSNRVFGQSQDSVGFGMQTAAKRLEALYPDRHKVEIQNSGEHFIVLLMIKL